MKSVLKYIVILCLSLGLLSLGGCAAIGTAVSHHTLQTQTEMSRTIFLTPVSGKNRSVYVQVTNTTGVSNFSITSQLIGALSAKGYQVYTNPADLSKAYYLLQVNQLKVGKISQTAAENMMGDGYGSTLTGAAVGAVVGAVASNSVGWTVAAGIAGAIGNTIINNAVKDVTYSGVIDVKITEQKTKKSYTTRIATSSNKVNLTFKEAIPGLETRLANSISGIFA